MRYKSRNAIILLTLTLLLRPAKSRADEDFVGYRRELYREDEGRISVDTDSLSFDVGLNDHIRLSGDLGIDAITGATPTGAPPQTKWPFQTFSGYYNNAYNQLFQAAINDPNNLILFQAGLFGPPNQASSFQAYTNNVAQNNPQLGSQATNSANASLAQQTNSPSFHNTKVPLIPLHDLRRSGSFSVPITFGFNTFTPGFAASSESDYHSVGISLNDSILLNNKNTTINLGWSHNMDRVRDSNLAWEGKVSDDIFVGLTQLLTPKSYVTVNFTYGQEYGYLTDPYRGVLSLAAAGPQENPEDAALIGENRPRRRRDQIFYVSFVQFITPLNGSAEAGYRFFHDTYGVVAHTIDLAWHQKIGKNIVFTPGFRYYNQTAAYFYSDLFLQPTLPEYYSSDYRLSELETFTASATLTWRVHKHIALDLSYARYIMAGLDGETSQSAYPSANIVSFGGRFFF